MRITAILITRKLKNGKHPIAIRVNIKKQRTFYSLGISVDKSEWDPKYGRVKGNHFYNQKILNEINRIEEAIIKGEGIREQKTDNFLEYATNLVSLLKPKVSEGRHRHYRVELNRLKKFSTEIRFSEITHNWLHRYENYIRETGVAETTLNGIWKTFEFFLNSAVREEVIQRSPAKGYKKPKYVQPLKDFLEWDEILKVESLLSMPLVYSMRKTVLFFLLGCYSGLRVSDWYEYKPSWVKGDRIILQAKKNGEIISFKMHSKLRNIIELIGEEKLDISLRTIRINLKGVARMAGIKKNIGTHSGRRSFGIRCRDLGNTTAEIAALLGTTERVAAVYSRLSGKHLDEAIKRWDVG